MNQKISIYENFTVIIPEHKRPEHLKRLLDYFLSYGIKVIIVDSSDIEFKYLSEFEDKVVYRFYPKTSLADKLNKIVSLIDTPFVFMCANDDFIVPEAVNEIISFLEKNNEYNSGQGIYIEFAPELNEINTSLRYQKTIDIDLNDNIPSERLYRLQSNYFQYYYSVFRTELFKRLISSVSLNGQCLIKNLVLLESYMSSYAAIDGKHIIIPTFYSARENIINSAGTYTDSIPAIIKSDKYREEYNSYIALLSRFLAEKEGIMLSRANQMIIQSVEIYLSNVYPIPNLTTRVKIYVKGMIKSAGIYGLIISLKTFFIGKSKVSSANLNGFEHWQKIEKYIRKYNYIYKNK